MPLDPELVGKVEAAVKLLKGKDYPNPKLNCLIEPEQDGYAKLSFKVTKRNKAKQCAEYVSKALSDKFKNEVFSVIEQKENGICVIKLSQCACTLLKEWADEQEKKESEQLTEDSQLEEGDSSESLLEDESPRSTSQKVEEAIAPQVDPKGAAQASTSQQVGLLEEIVEAPTPPVAKEKQKGKSSEQAVAGNDVVEQVVAIAPLEIKEEPSKLVNVPVPVIVDGSSGSLEEPPRSPSPVEEAIAPQVDPKGAAQASTSQQVGLLEEIVEAPTPPVAKEKQKGKSSEQAVAGNDVVEQVVAIAPLEIKEEPSKLVNVPVPVIVDGSSGSLEEPPRPPSPVEEAIAPQVEPKSAAQASTSQQVEQEKFATTPVAKEKQKGKPSEQAVAGNDVVEQVVAIAPLEIKEEPSKLVNVPVPVIVDGSSGSLEEPPRPTSQKVEEAIALQVEPVEVAQASTSQQGGQLEKIVEAPTSRVVEERQEQKPSEQAVAGNAVVDQGQTLVDDNRYSHPLHSLAVISATFGSIITLLGLGLTLTGAGATIGIPLLITGGILLIGSALCGVARAVTSFIAWRKEKSNKEGMPVSTGESGIKQETLVDPQKQPDQNPAASVKAVDKMLPVRTPVPAEVPSPKPADAPQSRSEVVIVSPKQPEQPNKLGQVVASFFSCSSALFCCSKKAAKRVLEEEKAGERILEDGKLLPVDTAANPSQVAIWFATHHR